MGNSWTGSGEEGCEAPVAAAPSFPGGEPPPRMRRAATVLTERNKRNALRWEVEQTLRSAVRRGFDDPRTHARLVEHFRLSAQCGSGDVEVQRALACAFSALPEPDLLLPVAATSADSVALSASLALSLGCSLMESALSGSTHAVDPAAQAGAPSSVQPNAPLTAPGDLRCECAMREPAKHTLWNETHPTGSVISLRGATLTVQCKREWAERERRRRYCAGHSDPDRLYAADAGPTASYNLNEDTIAIVHDPRNARVWSIAKKIQTARGQRSHTADGELTTVVKFRHSEGEEHTARAAVALCQRIVAKSDAARRKAAERKTAKVSGECREPLPRAHPRVHTKRNPRSQHASRTAIAAPLTTWLPLHGRHSLHTFARTRELVAGSDAQLDDALLNKRFKAVGTHDVPRMAAAVQRAADAARSEQFAAQRLAAKGAVSGAAASASHERHMTRDRDAGSVWLQWHSERRMERARAAAEERRAGRSALVYAALLSDAPEAHEAMAMYHWRVDGDFASAGRHFDRAIALRTHGGRGAADLGGTVCFAERVARTAAWMHGDGDERAHFGTDAAFPPASGSAAAAKATVPATTEDAAGGEKGKGKEAPDCESPARARERTRAGLNTLRLAYTHYWRARLSHSRALHLRDDGSDASQRTLSSLLDAAEASYKSAIRSAALGMQARFEEARGEHGTAYVVSELRNNKVRCSSISFVCLPSFAHLLFFAAQQQVTSRDACVALPWSAARPPRARRERRDRCVADDG